MFDMPLRVEQAEEAGTPEARTGKSEIRGS